MEKQKEHTIKADRLVSIDALRGFTMFMLVGGGYILRALGAAQSLVIALISTALEWLLLYYLYRNKYFIKL